MRWVICVPAWGRRCLELFLGPVLDSHAAALAAIDAREVMYIVHTDEPEQVADVVGDKTGCTVMCSSVPQPAPGSGHWSFGLCQKEALALAPMGAAIATLNADIVVSREFFAAGERILAGGKKLIAGVCTRTLPDGPVPVGASAAELLSWSIDHQHPVIEELYFGTGRSAYPSLVYFSDGDAVMIRGFHVGPMIVLKDRALTMGQSSDWDLAANYRYSEIHVVTRSDELAGAEISPADKALPVGAKPFTAKTVHQWARRKALPLHWWFFGHRIQVRGEGCFNDRELDRDLSIWKAA